MVDIVALQEVIIFALHHNFRLRISQFLPDLFDFGMRLFGDFLEIDDFECEFVPFGIFCEVDSTEISLTELTLNL